MIFAGKQRSNSSETGFTLLEMIVAVTLVAVMAVALWAVFRISIRSWARGTESMDANQRRRSVLSLVRKQLASAHGLFVPSDQQTRNLSLVFNGAENSLQFISLNSLRFQESPGLTLVSYELDQDSGGNYALVEKESRYLGRLPDEASFADQSRAIPIFENLASCLFEYFDPQNAGGESPWVREWDGQKLRRLPLAVSLTMVSQDSRGNILNRHMVVPIQAEANDMRVNYLSPFGTRGVVR